MSKRKKLRTSGEGVRPSKPPKNLKLGDSDRGPQSSKSGHLRHLEESEGKPGPASSTLHSREEPGWVVSSSPDEETGAPCRLLGPPEKEPPALPPSQNSVGRFVPQFSNPRKTVARKAETREEDLGSGAFSLETPPELSARQAGSQPIEESPGLAVQEARDPMWADGACPEQSSQEPTNPLPSRGDARPKASLEGGAGPAAPETASQDHLSEPGTNDSGPETQKAWVPGSGGQKGYLPSGDAEGKEPDARAPQGGGAQRGAEADLPGGSQEEGGGVLSTPASASPSDPAWGLGPATWCSEPRFVAQGSPDPWQISHGTGGDAEWSHNSPECSALGEVVIADLSVDPPELEKRVLEVARLDKQADARLPASPGGKVPDGGHRMALLGCTPITRETARVRGEVGQEDKPPSNIPVGPATSLALAPGNQEPTMGTGDYGHLAPDAGPGVSQKQVPGPDQEAAELGSWSHEQDPKGPSVSLQASGLLEHREVANGPQETRARQDSPDTPVDPGTPQPDHPHPADQATWGNSLAVELDFLPDSQIQEALDASDFESPAEQLFPAGSRLGPCWPGPNPCSKGDPIEVAKAQPSTHVGIQAREASGMEDATDVVRGLVVELSNLNRLIMSAHRDLEAFKRLSYRKAKPAGKAPLPYSSKGAGTVPQGEQPWRDL
uniref:Break repair meiotic recombinase recruitment factor 1 n=1 Tax=Prolemur simus TaxID=1328070 RepID=A0A8C9DDJ9_PROSS